VPHARNWSNQGIHTRRIRKLALDTSPPAALNPACFEVAQTEHDLKHPLEIDQEPLAPLRQNFDPASLDPLHQDAEPAHPPHLDTSNFDAPPSDVDTALTPPTDMATLGTSPSDADPAHLVDPVMSP